MWIPSWTLLVFGAVLAAGALLVPRRAALRVPLALGMAGLAAGAWMLLRSAREDAHQLAARQKAHCSRVAFDLEHGGLYDRQRPDDLLEAKRDYRVVFLHGFGSDLRVCVGDTKAERCREAAWEALQAETLDGLRAAFAPVAHAIATGGDCR